MENSLFYYSLSRGCIHLFTDNDFYLLLLDIIVICREESTIPNVIEHGVTYLIDTLKPVNINTRYYYKYY